MARSKEPLLDPLLRRAEDAGMVVSAAALALVEVGYEAWLGCLPAFPSTAHPAEFLDLPLWYEHPRVGVTLLVTVLGGMIAWAAWSVFGFMCNRSHGTVAATQRAMANRRLKAAALCAVVAGADLLLIQFLRT